MSKIADLSLYQRPREKAIRYGIKTLSDGELLAILIGSGTVGESSLEIAYRILSDNCGLIHSNTLDYDYFLKYKGLGRTKSLQLASVFELYHRLSNQRNQDIEISKNTHDIAKKYKNLFADIISEKLVVISFRKSLISEKVISIGNERALITSIRLIVQEVIRNRTDEFFLVHNHPSGKPNFSKADLDMTIDLINVCKRIGLRLIDHIVISNNSYYSFKEDQIFEY